MTNKKLIVDIEEDLHVRLKTKCAQKEVTIREIVVLLISDWLKKK